MTMLSGRAGLGASLSFLTALLWGLLPIALKEVLAAMDAYTITFYRFLSAGLVLWIWLGLKGQLPSLRLCRGQAAVLMLVAVIGLLLNYGFYLLALNHLDPRTAQVVIQLAPLLLMLGSVWLFKEPFTPVQRLGMTVMLLGLAGFFNERLLAIFSQFDDITWGLLLMVLAAVTWACYALAQKKLLGHYGSVQIMLVIYLAGALAFLPLSEPAQVLVLDGWQLGWLIFCGANTLVAYGAFAEALNHWEASKVSALLAVTPLLTFAFVAIMDALFELGFEVREFNWLAYLGAVLVVLGSAMNTLGHRLRRGR
ncbi:DMT family transporter [Gallaecimonas sp. GXIMD4217]|uniref:DMT family transporter n=1 Tax=Gallaecimonas sp. GXIMD4217 TaxID=3131927 RepID=UPI00311AEC73